MLEVVRVAGPNGRVIRVSRGIAEALVRDGLRIVPAEKPKPAKAKPVKAASSDD